MDVKLVHNTFLAAIEKKEEDAEPWLPPPASAAQERAQEAAPAAPPQEEEPWLIHCGKARVNHMWVRESRPTEHQIVETFNSMTGQVEMTEVCDGGMPALKSRKPLPKGEERFWQAVETGAGVSIEPAPQKPTVQTVPVRRPQKRDAQGSSKPQGAHIRQYQPPPNPPPVNRPYVLNQFDKTCRADWTSRHELPRVGTVDYRDVMTEVMQAQADLPVDMCYHKITGSWETRVYSMCGQGEEMRVYLPGPLVPYPFRCDDWGLTDIQCEPVDLWYEGVDPSMDDRSQFRRDVRIQELVHTPYHPVVLWDARLISPVQKARVVMKLTNQFRNVLTRA